MPSVLSRAATTSPFAPPSAVLTPTGGVVIGGQQSSPTDYGSGPMTGTGSTRAVLLELDGSGDYVDVEVFEATEGAFHATPTGLSRAGTGW